MNDHPTLFQSLFCTILAALSQAWDIFLWSLRLLRDGIVTIILFFLVPYIFLFSSIFSLFTHRCPNLIREEWDHQDDEFMLRIVLASLILQIVLIFWLT